jgi:hypothetical protein
MKSHRMNPVAGVSYLAGSPNHDVTLHRSLLGRGFEPHDGRVGEDPRGGTGQRARGLLSEAWNIQGWPTIYVLDSKGMIRYKHYGANDVKELDEVVDGLVKELEGETK